MRDRSGYQQDLEQDTQASIIIVQWQGTERGMDGRGSETGTDGTAAVRQQGWGDIQRTAAEAAAAYKQFERQETFQRLIGAR